MSAADAARIIESIPAPKRPDIMGIVRSNLDLIERRRAEGVSYASIAKAIGTSRQAFAHALGKVKSEKMKRS